MWPSLDQFTVYGHDMQFGTNVLGHFYLTQLLLPILVASAKSSQDRRARVVNVSSTAHMFAPALKKGGPVIYQNIVDSPSRTKAGTYELYGMSKAVRVFMLLCITYSSGGIADDASYEQGNILFSNALARKYADQGIVSISLHPGTLVFLLSGCKDDTKDRRSSLVRNRKRQVGPSATRFPSSGLVSKCTYSFYLSESLSGIITYS